MLKTTLQFCTIVKLLFVVRIKVQFEFARESCISSFPAFQLLRACSPILLESFYFILTLTNTKQKKHFRGQLESLALRGETTCFHGMCRGLQEISPHSCRAKTGQGASHPVFCEVGMRQKILSTGKRIKFHELLLLLFCSRSAFLTAMKSTTSLTNSC